MNFFRNKKLLTIVLIIFLLVFLPVTVIFLQQQTQTQSEAEQTTTLYFSPDTSQTPLQKNSQENFALDVMVNPGQNLTTLVKVDVSFDPTKVRLDGENAFERNTKAFPSVVEGPIYRSNSFSVTLSVGNDPSRAVSNVTKVGTLKLKATNATGNTPTEISFTDKSQIFSASSTDQAAENVLAGTSPAYVRTASKPVANCTLPRNTKQGEVFEAVLDGNQVVPPTDSRAAGRARVVLPSRNSITNLSYFSFCYNGLSSINSSVNIHFPAREGENADDEITLPVSGFPSGNIVDFPSLVDEDEIAYLRDGRWYIQVETIRYDDGEIRGQFGRSPQGDLPTPTPTLTPRPTRVPTATPRPTRVPTRTPTPTIVPEVATPTPQDLSVSFTASLHGIGSSGDNRNPEDSSLSNKNPKHPRRDVVVEAFNAQEKKITETSGKITYNEQTGRFEGSVDFGTSLSQGSYIIKLKTAPYLRANFPGIQTLNPGQTNELPSISLTAGDVNRDNVLDIRDYNLILGCYSDLLPAKSCDNNAVKRNADIQDDGSINQVDYNLFIRELSSQQGD